MPKAQRPAGMGNCGSGEKLEQWWWVWLTTRTPPHSLPPGVFEFKFQLKTQLWLLQLGYVLIFQGQELLVKFGGYMGNTWRI